MSFSGASEKTSSEQNEVPYNNTKSTTMATGLRSAPFFQEWSEFLNKALQPADLQTIITLYGLPVFGTPTGVIVAMELVKQNMLNRQSMTNIMEELNKPGLTQIFPKNAV